MKDTTRLKDMLQNVFRLQKLGVLATEFDGKPYCNLIAVTPSRDLRHLFFSTLRSTVKYRNLINSPFVSLLFDTRTNTDDDFKHALAVTALGTAAESQNPQLGTYRDMHIQRHPPLEGFMQSPDCTLFQVRVKQYIIVSSFQQVMRLAMD